MERFLLLHFPGVLLGSLIVVIGVAVSLGGLLLVRRNVAVATLEQHNDVAGFIIAVIGVIYAVVLAFVVISVWEQFDTAKANASQEANLVGLLYVNAVFYPGHTESIRKDLQGYAESVVNNEWTEMSAHQSDSPTTDRQVGVLLGEYRAIHPESTEEGIFYTESVRRLYELTNLRRARVDASGNELPSVLWTILIVGGVITIGFTYFFGVSHFGAHVLMVAALAAMIALTLFVILSLDLPFSGDLRISSDAMEQTIREFSHG